MPSDTPEFCIPTLEEIDPGLPIRAQRLIALMHEARETERPISELADEVVKAVVATHFGGYGQALTLQKPESLPIQKGKSKKAR